MATRTGDPVGVLIAERQDHSGRKGDQASIGPGLYGSRF